MHSSSALDDGRFPPGFDLANRYRILRLLGRGGTGEVYRANDLKLGQLVALKFLPESIAADPDRLARFHKEVRLARQVSHPQCVPRLRHWRVVARAWQPSSFDWPARSPNYPLLSPALNVIPGAVIILITIRFGLLAMIASFVASDILIHFPVTTDLSTWYASSTLLAYAIVFALAGYAFHSALAGRALFRRRFLAEA